MVELRWTNEAQTWLRDIFDYIAADNPQAAASVVEGIYAKAQVLLSFPDVGYRYRRLKRAGYASCCMAITASPICTGKTANPWTF